MEDETSKDSLKYQVLRLLAIGINSQVPLKEILQEAISKTLVIMELEAGSISLWDKENKEILCEATAGPQDKTEFLSALEKGAIHLMRKDFKIESVYLTYEKDGIHSLFSYPVRTNGRFLGAISGFCTGSRNLILEEEFLQALGNQLGLSAIKAESYLTKAELKKLEDEKNLLIEQERLSAIMHTSVAVNHEVNNPLTAILGNAQLLLARKENLDQETIDKLKIIEENALKIKEVTQDLIRIIEPVIVEYTGGVKMIDISRSKKKELPPES